MQAELTHGTLRLHAGRRFTPVDADRLRELLAALGPFSRVFVDFSGARERSGAAVAAAMAALAALPGAEVVVNAL
jgi:hypothetical protein